MESSGNYVSTYGGIDCTRPYGCDQASHSVDSVRGVHDWVEIKREIK